MTFEKITVLAGDVGGTKTTLALFENARDLGQPLAEETFPSAAFEGLDAVVERFLSHHDHPVERACFGIAGPVFSDSVTLTNIDWVIDAQQLQSKFGWGHVCLVNDLEAIGYAIPHLQAQDLCPLNPGTAAPKAPLAVLAPGTGLGEAFLIWNGSSYQTYPSEGGHASFAPTTQTERGLLEFLHQEHHHVSFERVCSGEFGIPNIYAYLKHSGLEEPAWLAQRLSATDDPTPIIAQAGMDESHPCALCRNTLEVFCSILGTEASNLVLTLLAVGGVYIAGGIPPKILPILRSGAFMKSFRNKGRFSKLLEDTPVHVVLNPKAGLLGAAYAGFHGL